MAFVSNQDGDINRVYRLLTQAVQIREHHQRSQSEMG